MPHVPTLQACWMFGPDVPLQFAGQWEVRAHLGCAARAAQPLFAALLGGARRHCDRATGSPPALLSLLTEAAGACGRRFHSASLCHVPPPAGHHQVSARARGRLAHPCILLCTVPWWCSSWASQTRAPRPQPNRLLLDLGADANQHAVGVDNGMFSSPYSLRNKVGGAALLGARTWSCIHRHNPPAPQVCSMQPPSPSLLAALP